MNDFQLAETNHWTGRGFQVLSFQLLAAWYMLWLWDQVHLRQIYYVPNNLIETTPTNQFGMVVQRNLVITLSPPWLRVYTALKLFAICFPSEINQTISPTQLGSSDWKSKHCWWAKALKARRSRKIQYSRGLSTRHQNKINGKLQIYPALCIYVERRGLAPCEHTGMSTPFSGQRNNQKLKTWFCNQKTESKGNIESGSMLQPLGLPTPWSNQAVKVHGDPNDQHLNLDTAPPSTQAHTQVTYIVIRTPFIYKCMWRLFLTARPPNMKLKIMYIVQIVHGSLTEPQLGFQLHHKPPSVAVSRKPELPHSTGQCKVPYPRPPNPARCRELPQSLYSLLEKDANKVQSHVSYRNKYLKHGRFAAYWLFFTIVRAERVRKSLQYLGRCSKMAGL